jgi:hypothetical protein
MKTSSTHLPSLLGGILFALSGLFLLGTGALAGLTSLLNLLQGEAIQAPGMILLAMLSFEALLLFGAAFFMFQKQAQNPLADQASSLSLPSWYWIVAVLTAGAALLLGHLVAENASVNWLILPVLTLPAIVLPLGLALVFAVQTLPLGARWETWAVLGLSMTLVPLLLVGLEVFAAIVLLIMSIAYVVSQPELAAELEGLAEYLQIIGPDPEAALEVLAPILVQPGVVVIVMLYMAVFVPAVEEIFKPLGVWLFAGKLNSIAQGFALGALSGAGYALIETVGASAQTTEWAALLLGRIGTALLHITTSALMGAAIVSAWRERRFLRLLGIYVLATLLHGLWNALAVLFSFSTLAELGELPGRLGTAQPVAIAGMSLLALGFLSILVVMNRRLRTGEPVNGSTPPQDVVQAG